jgi:Haem-binding domain
MKKKILLILILIIVAIQFIRPNRNLSTAITSNDISQHYNVPTDINNILQRSCNDCHSSNTTYPWYTNIQPIGWWMQHHVDEGKKELNFSEFGSYTPKKQDHKMEEVIEMIEKDEMPLNSYLWIHGNAKLSAEDKKALTDWAKKLRAEIAAVK